MKLTTDSTVPVYTVAGEGTARPLPEWIARKRRRSLKKDAQYANRVELLQDFEFEEASQCVRISEDGQWAMSTGTYKPQIHVHYLPHLSLSYARHTKTLNNTFLLLSPDSSKSLHLQSDRSLEIHNPSGLYYTLRIPRYGRDLKYNRRTAEALIPAVGVNANGNGEVYRLNLELGRFMKSFEVDVGDDDFDSLGGGSLQGGIRAGAVNCAAVAEESHGLLAFGTSQGTVECWDSRSRNRAAILGPPLSSSILESSQGNLRPEITALSFHPSGLEMATGSSDGLIHTYDLRSPTPLLRNDQGYGSPIQTLRYLSSRASSSSSISPNKLLTADRKSIKIFDSQSGSLWTSVEPAVDLNHVEWVPDSGMLLTANEGRQQYSFFIPQLGPAPKWCGFLDNLVEEMAEDGDADPHAFKSGFASAGGEVYDNYKFLDRKEIRDLEMEHLIGTDKLRPYMHGFFVSQRLFEQARLVLNPDLALQQRQKSIQEKIDKQRESKIRGDKKINVKVNRDYAEKLLARDEATAKKKAQRALRKADNANSDAKVVGEAMPSTGEKRPQKAATDLMDDDRFGAMFHDPEFEIDKTSHEYGAHNPSSVMNGEPKKRGLTAVEQEENEERRASSDEDDDSIGDDEAETSALRARHRNSGENDTGAGKGRIGSASYKKSGHQSKQQREKDLQQKAGPRMRIASFNPSSFKRSQQQRSFGARAASLSSRPKTEKSGEVVGEKEISFAPTKAFKTQRPPPGESRGNEKAKKDRRSASGNTFRRI